MGIGSRIDHGGLFRCCVATIIEDDRAEYAGRKMACTYCDAPLIVRDAVKYLVWEWDRTAAISMECITRSINAGLDSEDGIEMSAEEFAKRVVIEDARRRGIEGRDD
jgi:hypothetical protein